MLSCPEILPFIFILGQRSIDHLFECILLSGFLISFYMLGRIDSKAATSLSS